METKHPHPVCAPFPPPSPPKPSPVTHKRAKQGFTRRARGDSRNPPRGPGLPKPPSSRLELHVVSLLGHHAWPGQSLPGRIGPEAYDPLTLPADVSEVGPPEGGPELHHAQIPLGHHLPALGTPTDRIAHFRPINIIVIINITARWLTPPLPPGRKQ